MGNLPADIPNSTSAKHHLSQEAWGLSATQGKAIPAWQPWSWGSWVRGSPWSALKMGNSRREQGLLTATSKSKASLLFPAWGILLFPVLILLSHHLVCWNTEVAEGAERTDRVKQTPESRSIHSHIWSQPLLNLLKPSRKVLRTPAPLNGDTDWQNCVNRANYKHLTHHQGHNFSPIRDGCSTLTFPILSSHSERKKKKTKKQLIQRTFSLNFCGKLIIFVNVVCFNY